MNGRLLTWLDLPCADLARAQAFYKTLLGARGPGRRLSLIHI